MENESSFDFNFWTAFADLMLSFILVLCMLLFVNVVVDKIGRINLTQVENNQKTVINSIAEKYGTTPIPLEKENTFGISTDKSKNYDIKIQNDLNIQRITFADKLLFLPDGTEINLNGQKVLDIVGDIIRNQLPLIKEIQIQGHADTLNSKRFRSNTVLASERAISVLEYLQKKGIDPASNLMSATSFGEFKPVQRIDNEGEYNSDLLKEHNIDENLRSQNRRIELVLIYRR